MFDPSATWTFTAPASSDGRGEVAVVNDRASGNFVGLMEEVTRSAAIRPSSDNIPEGHGAVFGAQYYGAGAYTFKVALTAGTTWAASFARRDKLFRATNAMAADGTASFVESGGGTVNLNFRRQEYPQGPDATGTVLVALTTADPRAYGPLTSRTTATTHTFTPAGTVDTGPIIVVGTPSATVNISRTAPGSTVTLTFTGLSGGGAVTVNFKDHSITQGGVDKSSAISWPSSTWWELVPGVSNTVTITNSSTLDYYPAYL